MEQEWSVLTRLDFWMRTIHVAGTIMSVGAVTVTDSLLSVLHFRPRLAPLLARLLHVLSLVVWVGLLLLSVTGLWLVLDQPEVLDNPVFLAKMAIVLIVFINGVLMNLFVAPRFEDLSDEWHRDVERVNRFQIIAGIAAIISLIGWWGIVLVVMFNRLG